MDKFKIFVSSVQGELEIERKTVKNFIESNSLLRDHFKVFLFEDLPAKNTPARKAFLNEVGKSDIYLGILKIT